MKLKIKHINIVYPLIFIITIGLLFSCGNAKNYSISQTSIEIPPRIIFLNYHIKKTLGTSKSISLTGKTVVDGKFKNPKTTTKDTYGDLICLQLDKKSNILERTTIKNPLFKTIEFIDDSKSFHTKHIDLDSTNFSVRLQLKQNAQYISLIEVNPNNTSVSKPLITTKLN